MTKKELMDVIQDVTMDAGLESDPDIVENFASDLVDRLDEEFRVIDDEDEE